MTDVDENAALRNDGAVPLDAPCPNAYVVGVIIVEPSSAPPVVASLAPASAEIGSPHFTLVVTGSGFTPNSTIVFNGGDEPTTFVSPTSVTTEVQPSTAGAPIDVPVLVRSGARRSAPVTFSFVEPEPPPEPEPEEPDEEES